MCVFSPSTEMINKLFLFSLCMLTLVNGQKVITLTYSPCTQHAKDNKH